MIAFGGVLLTTGAGGTDTLPTAVVVAEVGGGIPRGIPDIGILGAGTAGGMVGTKDPSVGMGTGRGGIVGMVGIVGIMRYIAVSEEGGFGPTASIFSSPDSSFI